MRLGVNTHSLAESFFRFVAGQENRALTPQVHKPEVVNFNEQVWSVSDERRHPDESDRPHGEGDQ